MGESGRGGGRQYHCVDVAAEVRGRESASEQRRAGKKEGSFNFNWSTSVPRQEEQRKERRGKILLLVLLQPGEVFGLQA